MASTPHGSWAGSPAFGIRDLLEESRSRPDRIQIVLKEVNRALDDLGVTNVRAGAVSCESAPDEEVSRWVVTLVSAEDGTQAFDLRWTDGDELTRGST
jgi:hypothetical protein